ncbi:hypothetical protein [Paracoccus sp. JM45]|uniref:hypothetical protein n=1 Tax=Paracoccus sp. JM45 TaxID=2283626 RepID=UPI000E6CB3E4|nr:hypothetical protein [Paracoccus sp. JM45]RJE78605.1 hypothetical protein DWB67_16605 [Paracoccus sp. JM45]
MRKIFIAISFILPATSVFAATHDVEAASYREHLTFICYMLGTSITLEDWDEATAAHDDVAQHARDNGAPATYMEAMRHAGIARAESVMEGWADRSEAWLTCNNVQGG